jgi:hypothetical protein
MTSPTFTVTSNGGFIDPNGNSFDMRGLNATPTDALAGFANVMKDYPGLTAIRLACDSKSNSAALIDQVIQKYTGAGVVVELEDHYGGENNVAWYQQMAQTYKGNPRVFLETPNEPKASNTAQNQIGIINAIKATGFNNPIGLQPIGGYDFSNISTVTAAVGKTQIFVTPHIYSSSTDPTAAAKYVAADIQTAKNLGLFPAIDEFGNAMDGVTLDPQGNTVDSAVIAANQAGKAGAIFWAMDNGNHANGADSAFLKPDGSQLTSTGTAIQPWLRSPTPTPAVPPKTTPTTASPTPAPAVPPKTTPTASPTPTPAAPPTTTASNDTTPCSTFVLGGSHTHHVVGGDKPSFVHSSGSTERSGSTGATAGEGEGEGAHDTFGKGYTNAEWSRLAADASHLLKGIGHFVTDHLPCATTDVAAATKALTGTIANTQAPDTSLPTMHNFSTNSIHV